MQYHQRTWWILCPWKCCPFCLLEYVPPNLVRNSWRDLKLWAIFPWFGFRLPSAFWPWNRHLTSSGIWQPRCFALSLPPLFQPTGCLWYQIDLAKWEASESAHWVSWILLFLLFRREVRWEYFSRFVHFILWVFKLNDFAAEFADCYLQGRSSPLSGSSSLSPQFVSARPTVSRICIAATAAAAATVAAVVGRPLWQAITWIFIQPLSNRWWNLFIFN